MLASSKKVVGRLHGPITAWIVLICGLLVTGIAWKLSSNAVEKQSQEKFHFQVDELVQAIDSRIKVYEQVLWGGAGLFEASETVERKEFEIYVRTLRLEDQWPGIQGVGWSVPLEPGEVNQLEDTIKREGFNEFQVTPRGTRDFYTSIIYLEPFDWRNKRAFGYDMWSNEARREAMRRAAEEGVASTSSAITLVQETKEDVQLGFLTYVPVYENDGRQQDGLGNLRGWIYAAFRVGDLMAGIQKPSQEIEFRLHDGSGVSGDSVLYTTRGWDSNQEGFYRVESLNLQGREWTLEVSAARSPQITTTGIMPAVVAVCGLVIDCLLFYLITVLVYTQKKAEEIAENMTVNLREANEKLSSSNAELERFATLASHDLQEPLRGITSFSQLLEAEYASVLDDEGRSYLNNLMLSTERMRRLIKDLVAYNEINQMGTERETVSTQKMLEELSVSFESRLEESGLQLSFQDLPQVQAPKSLRLVFEHLISNALMYKGETGKVITITAHKEEYRWIFCVADTGIGVEENRRKRIFELFVRLHRWEDIPGTGLGLAFCRKMVEMQGGEIWHEDNHPNGSKFFFSVLDQEARGERGLELQTTAPPEW